MRKVIGIGETVLDIIFKDNQPIGAYPGGSTFNALISLGRSGINTTFISEIGNDRVGIMIKSFLKKNGVDNSHVNVFPDSKSPLSLAFLNEDNNADYLFYKDHPHDKLDFTLPDIQPDDIVLFGSYYAVNPVIRPQVVGLLEYARKRGAIIYYDVNFRPAHLNDVMRITPNLLENLEYADIVRGSSEDFQTLYKTTDAAKIYQSEIAFYCQRFICTQGSDDVRLFAENKWQQAYPVPHTIPISTIGAGDNFNAGFIFGIIKYGITNQMFEQGLSQEQWNQLVTCALHFSEESCKSIHNYVSPEFGKQMQAELTKY